VTDALGNGTREVPHIDSKSDAEWHILWTADGQEICRVPQLRGDIDTEPVMRDIAHAIANAGPLLNAAFAAGAAEERARVVALCLERATFASAAGHHLVAVAWDEVREALEREGKS